MALQSSTVNLGPPQPPPEMGDLDEGNPSYADELAPPASDDPAIPPVPRTGGVGASLLGAVVLGGVLLVLLMLTAELRKRQRQPPPVAGPAPARSLAHP